LIDISHIGTLQRFCQNDGTWAMTVPQDIQCQTCFGDGRPVKVKKIDALINFFDCFVFSLIRLVL
jgi:hypothetical protein